jgi:hypothetical protein
MNRYIKVVDCTDQETFNEQYTKPGECNTEFIIGISTLFPC